MKARAIAMAGLAAFLVCAAPFAVAQLPTSEEYTNGKLILDASQPAFPIVGYKGGTSNYVDVIVRNAPSGIAGIDLVDPQGSVRFANQISSSKGMIWFSDVLWTNPYGEWHITYLSGANPISAERINWDKDFNYFAADGALIVLEGKVIDDRYNEGELRQLIKAQLEPSEPASAGTTNIMLLAFRITIGQLPPLPNPLEANGDEEAPPPDPPRPQCPPPNWIHQVTHYKWVNRQVVHSPNPGRAELVNNWGSSKDKYAFGNGGFTQELEGVELNTQDGGTTGDYRLHTVSFYKNNNHQNIEGCPRDKVVINSDQGDGRVKDLFGASKFTDEDDLEDWWDVSTVPGWNVKALTLQHRYENQNNQFTTETAGEKCETVQSVAKEIYGIDVDVSFTVGNNVAGSVGGRLAYVTTDDRAEYYRYCYGKETHFQIHYLGGDSRHAKAFKSTPAPADDNLKVVVHG